MTAVLEMIVTFPAPLVKAVPRTLKFVRDAAENCVVPTTLDDGVLAATQVVPKSPDCSNATVAENVPASVTETLAASGRRFTCTHAVATQFALDEVIFPAAVKAGVCAGTSGDIPSHAESASSFL